MAGSSCEVAVLEMNEPQVAKRARGLGIQSVPTVVVNGNVAGCCISRAPNQADLLLAGVRKAV